VKRVVVDASLDRSCPLVTADRRLYNALTGGPFPASLVWVEEIAQA